MRRWSGVLIAGLLLVTGCRSGIDLSTARGQMRFGVQAARIDLWREARFRFERAVEIDPTDAMARNNLAVAYEGAGEFEKARETYVEALRLDRSNEFIQRNYSRFVEFYSKYSSDPAGSETQGAKKSDSAPPEVPEAESAPEPADVQSGAEDEDEPPDQPAVSDVPADPPAGEPTSDPPEGEEP